jgi:hypothetical protein
MLEIATESDLPYNYLLSDFIKNIITSPLKARAIRIFFWKRKLAVNILKREKTATFYGLRYKPAKKSL